MDNLEELQQQAFAILQRELKTRGLERLAIEVRVYGPNRVGVQGDERTHYPPCEIRLLDGNRVFWDANVIRELSTTITNEIRVNTVLYSLESFASED